jgi:hypothetical protein
MFQLKKNRDYVVTVPYNAFGGDDDYALFKDSLEASGANVRIMFVNGVTQIDVVDVTPAPERKGGTASEGVTIHIDEKRPADLDAIAQQLGEGPRGRGVRSFGR